MAGPLPVPVCGCFQEHRGRGVHCGPVRSPRALRCPYPTPRPLGGRGVGVGMEGPGAVSATTYRGGGGGGGSCQVKFAVVNFAAENLADTPRNVVVCRAR